ncbi:effector-associated constant component EACC1, partial [Streptomyces decoyicus]
PPWCGAPLMLTARTGSRTAAGAAVRVRIGVERDTETGEAAQSLYTWLSGDPEVLAGAGLTPVRRAGAPGPMGPVLEAVEAVFDSGVQLASLVVAVASWRSTRPRADRVHIERAGVRVTVDGGDPEAVARVLRALGEGGASEAGSGEGDAAPADRPGRQD